MCAFLAACGADSTKTVVPTVTAPTPTVDTASVPTVTTPPPDPTSCTALGITRNRLREGNCIDTNNNGARIQGVNRGSTLRLKQLYVSYGGYTTQDTIPASTGTAAAQGTFVIMTLTVRNKLNSPAVFDQHQDQIILALGSRNYSENFDAENNPGTSFVRNSDPIQPGNSKTGTVVFDIPKSIVKHIDTDGDLIILQFSDAGQRVRDAKQRVGIIRTYH